MVRNDTQEHNLSCTQTSHVLKYQMSQSHGLRKTITISIFLEKVRYHISAPHLQRSRENFAQLVILEYYSV